VARPFKFDTSTTPNSIKEMTDSEMNWIAHRILLAFASSDSGRGRVRVNTGTGTDIGTFVDTKRPGAIGDHPVGTTINSTDYTFYQELTGTETEEHNSPVVFDTTLDGLQKASNARLNADINRRTFDIMSASGLASYRLSASAPAGGTWTTIATITDTSLDADITTKLWRKTSESAPTVVRPLVFDSVLDGIQMISDAESSLLLEQYINFMLSTGKGQYKAQSSAPSTGGTWVQMGDAFSDTRQQIGDVNYSGTFTGYSQQSFTGYSQQFFTGDTSYSSTVSQVFALNYAGRIHGYYTGYYTGYYSPTFAQDYTGTYTQDYTNTSYSTFTGATTLNTKEDVSTIKLWLRTA
jgi:hypothetical protein